MTMGMTLPSTSPTVALFAAAAVAAAGIAYCSSASSTMAFGTLLLEILHVAGKMGMKDNGDKTIGTKKTSNDSEKRNEFKIKGDDLNKDFISWLDREENEKDQFRKRNKCRVSKEDDLTDPHWMSEMVRNALLSTAGFTSVTETAISHSCKDETPSTSSTTSTSMTTEKILETRPLISQLSDGEKESRCETAFRQSFRALQEVTETMIRDEPSIREDFFNGVITDSENDQREEEKNQGRRRSLSLSSSSSSPSTISSSASSYEITKNDSLVEEEGEVERLLTYLRFVELAKEEATPSPSSPSSLSLSHSSSCESHDRTTVNFPWRRERIVSDTDGYELLRSGAMEIHDATNTHRAKVTHIVAVHRGRKELLVAIHYDRSSFPSSATNSRDQIKTILMSSLLLQQQDQSATSNTSAPSNSFLLLDQAVESLSEEIIYRYTHANATKGNDTSSSYLSSGYSLVLCGHSLGAALACRLGNALTDRNRNTISKAFEVRVYAFGPPPCLPSRQKLCPNGDDSGGDYPYIVSIVNNHDCVPRWTESNLVGLRISLRWTMNRKKRHFEEYYSRYNRLHPSANSATHSEAAAARRLSPRIPPFSMAFNDWNLFLKSNQEPNSSLPYGDIIFGGPRYIVPGKVVTIWNHPQDPMIIGAKVHLPGEKSHVSCNDCQQLLHHHRGDIKNHDVLGRLWIDEGMFSDHTFEAYRSNLELLLGQVANTI